MLIQHVPYILGTLKRDTRGRLFEEVVCPSCGEAVACRIKKDFESFSRIEWAQHYMKHENLKPSV